MRMSDWSSEGALPISVDGSAPLSLPNARMARSPLTKSAVTGELILKRASIGLTALASSSAGPIICRPRPLYSSCARTRFGSSSMHGAHHDAQKLISTQRPLSDARLSVLPSLVTKLIAGAHESIGPSPQPFYV